MPDLDIRNAHGTSNMGSLTPETDDNRVARFLIKQDHMAISSLRVRFATVPGEGGTGTAELVIRVDSHRGSAFDMTLWNLGKKGIGKDVNFRVPDEQLDHFYIGKGDVIVLTWTNPDDGDIEWGATLALRRRNTNAV